MSKARYDAIADFYEGFAPDVYNDPPTAALLRLVGDVTGLRILDLACGHGMLTRELSRRGGHVTGVDISAPLISKALTRNDDIERVTYLEMDAAAPDALLGEHFDVVVSRFGLSDIDELDAVLDTVARVLRPGGLFAFCILHPCFPGWPSKDARPSWDPATGYYDEGFWRPDGPPHGVRPRVGANHRMLCTYINALAERNLLLERLEEPTPGDDWLDEPPEVGPVPVYFVGRCRRQTAQRAARQDRSVSTRGG